MRCNHFPWNIYLVWIRFYQQLFSIFNLWCNVLFDVYDKRLFNVTKFELILGKMSINTEWMLFQANPYFSLSFFSLIHYNENKNRTVFKFFMERRYTKYFTWLNMMIMLMLYIASDYKIRYCQCIGRYRKLWLVTFEKLNNYISFLKGYFAW